MAKNRQREREARVSVRSLFLSLSSSLRFLSRSLKAPMLPSLSFSLVHSRGRGVQHHASSTHVQIIQRGEIAPATNTCKAYTRKCTWNTTQGQDSGQRDRESAHTPRQAALLRNFSGPMLWPARSKTHTHARDVSVLVLYSSLSRAHPHKRVSRPSIWAHNAQPANSNSSSFSSLPCSIFQRETAAQALLN